MKNPYVILGLDPSASEEAVKKAYRKLAQKHHPDKGGDEAKFKEIKEAYETITNPKPQSQQAGHNARSYNFTSAEEFHEFMAQQFAEQRARAPIGMTLKVDIKKAFEGCKIPLNINGQTIEYQFKAGLPQGVLYQDEVQLGDAKRILQIQVLLETGKFEFVTVGTRDGMNFSGDLITDVEVDVLDIIMGGYTVVEDFLGSKLQVRIPAGLDLDARLKVARHGYSHWSGDHPAARGDLYLRVKPKIMKASELDKAKVEALCKLVTNSGVVTDSAAR